MNDTGAIYTATKSELCHGAPESSVNVYKSTSSEGEPAEDVDFPKCLQTRRSRHLSTRTRCPTGSGLEAVGSYPSLEGSGRLPERRHIVKVAHDAWSMEFIHL